MNKNKIINIILDILLILLVSYLTISNIFMKKEIKEDYDLLNSTTKKFNDEYLSENLKFSDSEMIYIKNYKTNISVNFINTSNDTYFLKGISAILFDETEKEIYTLYEDTMFTVNSNSSYSYIFETKKNLIENTYFIKYIPIYDIVE